MPTTGLLSAPVTSPASTASPAATTAPLDDVDHHPSPVDVGAMPTRSSSAEDGAAIASPNATTAPSLTVDAAASVPASGSSAAMRHRTAPQVVSRTAMRRAGYAALSSSLSRISS